MDDHETRYRVNEQGMIVEEIDESENEPDFEKAVGTERMVLRKALHMAQMPRHA